MLDDGMHAAVALTSFVGRLGPRLGLAGCTAADDTAALLALLPALARCDEQAAASAASVASIRPGAGAHEGVMRCCLCCLAGERHDSGAGSMCGLFPSELAGRLEAQHNHGRTVNSGMSAVQWASLQSELEAFK